MTLAWQASLLDVGELEPSIDAEFRGLVRHQLDADAWIDHCPGWLSGADEVFAALVEGARWQHPTRVMYGNEVQQPRLSTTWRLSNGTALLPVLEEARAALSARYGREFDSGGLNLYRDGRDSVAWHGDRIAKEIVDPIVGIVSLGHPRKFLLRPKGGGRSTVLVPGNGDLIVTGGTCQRTWQHSVPKVKAAGPRMSITFRHS